MLKRFPVFVIVFCLFLGSENSLAKSLKLVVHYPSSERWHTLGKQTAISAKMALKKFNAQLKESGIEIVIEAIEYDFYSKKKQADVAKKIISDAEVIAVVSYADHEFSSAKLPLITWNQRSEIIKDKVDSTFRIALADNVRQTIAADYVHNTRGAKTVSILLDGEPFSVHYQDGLKEKLKDGNLKVLEVLTLASGQIDRVENIAKKLLKKKPDVLIHVGSGKQKSLNLLSVNLKKKGVEIPTLCLVDYPPDSIPAGLQYLYISLFDTRTGTNPPMDSLLSEFESKQGASLGGIGIYAYESAQLVFTALLSLHEKSIPITRESLSKEIRQTQLQGITGLVTFDPNGNRVTGEYIIGSRTFDAFKVLHTGKWPLKTK
jgi:ABC-type branched-subunit amino acid transport system substrate-binding protein